MIIYTFIYQFQLLHWNNLSTSIIQNTLQHEYNDNVCQYFFQKIINANQPTEFSILIFIAEVIVYQRVSTVPTSRRSF